MRRNYTACVKMLRNTPAAGCSLSARLALVRLAEVETSGKKFEMPQAKNSEKIADPRKQNSDGESWGARGL